MLKNIKYTHIPGIETCSFVLDHVKIFWHEQIKLHAQDSWELSYIINGSGTRIIGDTIEPFESKEVVLIPPNIPHCWRFDKSESEKIENITVTFTSEFLERCIHTFPELGIYITKLLQTNTAVSFGGNTLGKLHRILAEMSQQQVLERLSSFVLLIPLVASLEDKKAIVGNAVHEYANNERMQKILLYIMNNFQETIKLEDVAKLVNLDKSSFCIFFKKMTGKTFFTYLTDYRIETSCQMITKSGVGIAEACYASGFKDVPYYNRTFKKLKGMTPTQYKQYGVSGCTLT